MFLDLLIYVFYLSNGMVPHIEYETYEIYIFAVLLINDIILIFGLSLALWNATNIMYKTEISAALCGILYQFWFKILARTNKKYILNTTDTLRENSKFGKTNFLAKMYRKLKVEFLPLMLTTLVFILAGFNVSFLRFLVDSKVDYNNPDIYVVPFLFKVRSIDSFVEYVTLLSLQIAFFTPEIVAYLSTIVYVCFVLANLQVHVDEIAAFMEHIFAQNYLVERIGRNDGDEMINLHREVKNLVVFQQYFYRYLNDVVGMGKIIFNSMLSVVILSFVLLILSIQVGDNMVAKLKIIFVILTFMLMYFILCYAGETICRMNGMMQSAYYDVPWYRLTPRFRKYLIMLMIQTNSKFQVKLMDMYTINLMFYANTMKIVYSIANFILFNHKL